MTRKTLVEELLEAAQALSSALTHHPNRERMDPMKLKTFALSVGTWVLAAFLMGATCTKPVVVGPVPPPGTPGFVNCSDTAIHNAAIGLLPAVENAVASGNWESALATLIAQEGGPLAVAEVECAVAWIVSKAEANTAMASADPLEVTKAAHGKAWLAEQGVQFATPVGP